HRRRRAGDLPGHRPAGRGVRGGAARGRRRPRRDVPPRCGAPGARNAAAAIRRGAASRRDLVGQYRRGRPVGLHRHRAGGQPGQPVGGALPPARPLDPDLGRARRRDRHAAGGARRAPPARHRRALRGLHPPGRAVAAQISNIEDKRRHATSIQFAMRAGADGRPEPTVARQSSPELALLAEFALPLPSFFLTSIAGAFGFGAGDAGCLDGCLPAATAPVSAEVALPLTSSFLTAFLTSLAAVFGFGAGDAGCLGGCLPTAVAPVLAEVALPLPSSILTSFLTSLASIFGFGAGD